MNQREAEHTRRGEAGVISRLSGDGLLSMVAMAGARCQQDERQTIQAAAVSVYDGFRAVQREMGIIR